MTVVMPSMSIPENQGKTASDPWPVGCISQLMVEQGADRRHDELLRMECLRQALSDVRSAGRQPYAAVGGWSPPEVQANSPEVLSLAREIYREVTGRKWPE